MALKDETDFRIVGLLVNLDAITFSELKKELDINPSELNRRLNRLMTGGLINNYYAKRKDYRGHSFYEATTLAIMMFEKFAELDEPRSPIPIQSNPFYKPGPEIDAALADLRNIVEKLESISHSTKIGVKE